ncbi:MAG: hypothetical protein HWN66_16685 [Candidatus Helarchaeota archaeon]|nr:hypothetical protein [Candidatus Helarchaeota archaeon]
MPNTFNISVKPEIAAVSALVTIVDTVVDAIRATDVPGINSNIDANETKLIIIDTVCDQIRDIDVPNIQANIDSNETKIDTVDTVVDAIQVKTDGLPYKIRGVFSVAYEISDSGTLLDVINISGQGKLFYIVIRCDNAGDTVEVVLTVDNATSRAYAFTGSSVFQVVYLSDAYSLVNGFDLNSQDVTTSDINSFNLEFATALRVQFRRSAGTNDNVRCKVGYSLDDL